MEERLTRELLADLYMKFRNLRTAHHEVHKMSGATRLALRRAPGFEDEYAKHWDELSTELDDQVVQLTIGLDEAIRRLRDFS